MTTDQDLVVRVKNGCRQSFSELVRRHQKPLLRMALRVTKDLESAEDVVQDTFLKAYKKIHLFQGRSAFKSWLFQIGLNTARNKLRKRRYGHSSIDNEVLPVDAEAERALLWRNIRKLIGGEVAKLPGRQRVALELRIYEDLSFKEIAEIMECPYDTAKANYRHALLKLRHRAEEIEELKNFQESGEDIVMSSRMLLEVKA